jgi:CheY-like chemotaxis protein
MDTIIRACTRGRDVVKSLLYFARKDLDTMGPVNLNAIAGEMVQLLSYTTLKRVRVTTDFQDPLGLIEGDGGALSHALINVCVNAVDAMPDGGTLVIRTRQSAERGIEIGIKDSGSGMDPEVVQRAIEPFFTTKPMGRGTGLGLAMVYGTVMAHKGSFEIHSEPGQGTEVIMGFPPLQESPEAAAQARETVPPPPMGPIRILLVDDDELIRLSVGPMLTALGHEVHTATTGQEALDRFQAGLEVDLVVLDMNMPGLNGAQTLEKLLTLRPGQVVLMATGYSDASIAPLLEGHPNVSSLRKPFSITEIRTKLESLEALRQP